MIGVNSIQSASRLRSRSLGSVRSARDSRDPQSFRRSRTPRSRSLKPLAFPDLLGQTQEEAPRNAKQKTDKKKKVEQEEHPSIRPSVHPASRSKALSMS